MNNITILGQFKMHSRHEKLLFPNEKYLFRNLLLRMTYLGKTIFKKQIRELEIHLVLKIQENYFTDYFRELRVNSEQYQVKY
jgi:hypothetical protein